MKYPRRAEKQRRKRRIRNEDDKCLMGVVVSVIRDGEASYRYTENIRVYAFRYFYSLAFMFSTAMP